jgi:hypothetical protein
MRPSKWLLYMSAFKSSLGSLGLMISAWKSGAAL